MASQTSSNPRASCKGNYDVVRNRSGWSKRQCEGWQGHRLGTDYTACALLGGVAVLGQSRIAKAMETVNPARSPHSALSLCCRQTSGQFPIPQSDQMSIWCQPLGKTTSVVRLWFPCPVAYLLWEEVCVPKDLAHPSLLRNPEHSPRAHVTKSWFDRSCLPVNPRASQRQKHQLIHLSSLGSLRTLLC